jgi:hypothetical protein
MAFETIRSFLGQALQQKLLQQTPAYQQQLMEGELKNQMLAMEMDQLFPLKVQALTKELEYMVDPMAKIQAQELYKYKTQEALLKYKADIDDQLMRLKIAGQIAVAQTPRIVKQEGTTALNEFRAQNVILAKIKSLRADRSALEEVTTIEDMKAPFGVHKTYTPKKGKEQEWNAINRQLENLYDQLNMNVNLGNTNTEEEIIDEDELPDYMKRYNVFDESEELGPGLFNVND